MPCETMDFKSFSSEDICSSNKSQAEWWKTDKLSKGHGFDQGIKPMQVVSNFSDSDEVNIIAARHESSLFSSSPWDLFSRKLRLSANNALHGHSVDAIASYYEEEKLCVSLEELEAQIIGNLLQDEDEDEDELDLFSSNGGLDLEDVDSSSFREKNCEILDKARNTSFAVENPSGEHPSRTLSVRNTDSEVKDSELKALFEQFGDIDTFDRDCKNQGNAMISYYDIRAAQKAMRALQNQLFSCRKFDIHYSIPKVLEGCSPEGVIQLIHQKSSPIKPTTSFQGLHGISSSVPNTLPSLIKLKSVGIQCEVTESSCSGQLNIDRQATLAFNPHSLQECRHSFTNAIPCNPLEVAADINLKTQYRIDKMQFGQVNSNGPFMDFDERVSNTSRNGSSSFPLPGNHGKWSNSYPPPRRMWPNSPSYFNGICAAPTLQKLNELPMSPSHMISTVLPINNHHVQSHPVDFVSHNMFPHSGLNFHNQRGMSFPGRNHIHMVNSFDTNRHIRSRRNVGAANLVDMKRYELDIDCIIRGEDNRTTLMIKNIPNKYTSEMLLAAIDEHHEGTYDFVYLPIDFRNKCNVGYAFINMTSPSLIIPFYKVFNGKKWEKFNSEKVASFAYARIQGKTALVNHFQHSSLMNVDKHCRPILIDTDGPNAGDQVHFPITTKPGRVRSNIHEEDSISKESDLRKSHLFISK